MRQTIRARRDIAKIWLARILIVTAAWAMLATAAPDTFGDTFERTLTPSPVQLTSAQPSQTIEIVATATGLSPSLSPTTDNAVMTINAQLRSEDGATDNDGGMTEAGLTIGVPRWITVRLDDGSPDSGAGTTLSVLTEFTVSHPLHFTSDCQTPATATSSCQSVVRLQFAREDGGQTGGVVQVSWSATFFSSVSKRWSEPRPVSPALDHRDSPAMKVNLALIAAFLSTAGAGCRGEKVCFDGDFTGHRCKQTPCAETSFWPPARRG